MNADFVAFACQNITGHKIQLHIAAIKKIDHYNKHCRMPVTFSGHHGMTLQFDVRNDDDRVIKNAYIICIVLFSLMSLIDCGSIFGKI